jgi:hypothetical protein
MRGHNEFTHTVIPIGSPTRATSPDVKKRTTWWMIQAKPPAWALRMIIEKSSV